MSGSDDNPSIDPSGSSAREPVEDSSSEAAQDADDEREPSPAEQAADFVSFIVGLATSAIAHLGDADEEEGGAPADLVLARQTIDILGMLEEKTKGNLTGDEERILSHLLYDLRIRYVESVRRRG